MQSSSPSNRMPTSPEEAPLRKQYASFFVLFFTFYMAGGAYGYFMIYLKSIGFDTLQMALLTSAAALFAMVVQPYIGRLADRSPTKNAVFGVTLVASAIAVVLMGVHQAFWYILIFYTIFLVTRNVLYPLADTITLEFTTKHSLAFGPVRVMGCLGYALMSAIAGTAAGKNPVYTFYLYAGMLMVTFVALRWVPKSPGMQSGKKSNPLLIFRNRLLLKYTLFAIMFSMTKSFYHQFFSVYFTSELGGPTHLYGLLVSVAALTEIPSIFWMDKLIARFGTRKIVLVAGVLDALRWLLTAVLINPYAQLGMHAILGANNMVMSMAMIIFVNRVMPPETKATGQTTYTMMTSVGSLLLGNLLGGALSNALGMRTVFYICACVNVAAICLLWFDQSSKAADL